MSFLPAPLTCGAVLLTLAAAPGLADTPVDLEKGRVIFNETAAPNCGICHTLADAGSQGAVGPNLDELKPDAEKIRAAVVSGVGVMPPFEDSLSAAQIDTVVNYVAAVVGNPAATAEEAQATPAAETTEEQDPAQTADVQDAAPTEADAMAESDAGSDALAALTDEDREILAMGDAEAGEKVFRKCKSCHTVEKGGADRVGPRLYGIVGDTVARAEGFKYSRPMSAIEGDWTPAFLAEFLADPRGTIKGTKMGFAGLRKEQDRADVIAYLDAHSDAPLASAE
ncbi:c-type cytochrome [Sulfitobacter aestuarii]|uniref:C-type cytochrome n=1 Tax=Sulfitobacter aestuarii TaxID=2161676 RepID=A0ABW5U3X0_9RHOB